MTTHRKEAAVTGKFFDAGRASGNAASAFSMELARIIEAEGLEISAIHASAIRPGAPRNDFLLCARVRDAAEGVMITRRLGARIGALNGRVMTFEQSDGDPVSVVVFVDAPLSVERDH